MSRRPSAAAQLEALLESAHSHQLHGTVAERASREVVRWGKVRARPERVWQWPLAAGCAAALVLVIWWNVANDELDSKVASAPVSVESVALGQRVVIQPSADAQYVVRATGGDSTRIEVVRGAVTARLFAGEGPHALTIEAGALRVTATGTIFTVGVDESGVAYSKVHEGSVALFDGDARRSLSAGEQFPVEVRIDGAIEAAATALEARAPVGPRAESPSGPRAESPSEPTVQSVDASLVEPEVPSPESGDTAPSASSETAASSHRESAVSLWRRARAARAGGLPDESLQVLEELSRRKDSTWSPLAVLEMARICESELSRPAEALRHARRFLRDASQHSLAAEARRLACRVAGQAGERNAPECSDP